MKHTFEQKVYYSDTDAYGVVWHGSYLRWLEMGRVEYCEDLGLNLIELEKQDIVMPVTNMNIRYKASGRLNDIVVVDTDDATLVCDKEHAGEIKKILAKLREEGKNEYL